MQIILNEQGFVEGYALIGSFDSSIAVIVDEPENIDDFERNYRSYCLSADNKLIKDNDKQREIENNKMLRELRLQREKICFPYVNRGELWYNNLTTEQKEELNLWYQEWLNVTKTMVAPTTPNWLN